MKGFTITISIFLFMPLQSFSSLIVQEYVPRSPIIIEGNDDFTHENGVIAGNGTKENPYIIEGWEINASGEWHGIVIKNTTAYVIIRNCYIHNAGCAILIKNASNIIIQNLITEFNNFGISIIISKNVYAGKCYTESIYLGTDENCSIENCHITHSAKIIESVKINIINNFIRDGLLIKGYNKKHFFHNILNNTASNGSILYYVNQSNVVIKEDAAQVFLIGCKNFEITMNSSNTMIAVEMAYSSNISILNSSFYGKMSWASIFGINSSSISIINSKFEDNGCSIFFHATSDFKIINSYFYGYESGLVAELSKNGAVRNCTFENGEFGMEFYLCRNIDIKHCNIHDNECGGVLAQGIIGLSIHGCNVYNNGDDCGGGIGISQGIFIRINRNNIFNNSYYGIYADFAIVNALYNYYGSFFGPSRNRTHPLRGDIVYGFASFIATFPWKIFPVLTKNFISATYYNHGMRKGRKFEELPLHLGTMQQERNML